MLHVLEYEVEAAGHAGCDESVELDDVGVVEAAEDEDLARHEADALWLEVVEAHLLERHDLAAHRVARLVHVAVRTLPDLPSTAHETMQAFVGSITNANGGRRTPQSGAWWNERESGGRKQASARTLSIFSKESARRGVQPSMASPATAESQAGQPAATCSPRALFAKLPPTGAGRDERERLSRRAGFSAAGCSAFPAASCGGGAAAPVWPYVIHGHYADAAEAAAHLAGALNVPMVMTGHSLGRNKLEQLLQLGRMPRAEIQAAYRIARRVEAEETGLDAAEVVVTSTKQEVEEQWGLYDGFDAMVERKLRVRRSRGVSCLGRYMPRMAVIPPGMDFSYVDAQDLADGDGDLQALMSPGTAKKPMPPIWSEVDAAGAIAIALEFDALLCHC